MCFWLGLSWLIFTLCYWGNFEYLIGSDGRQKPKCVQKIITIKTPNKYFNWAQVYHLFYIPMIRIQRKRWFPFKSGRKKGDLLLKNRNIRRWHNHALLTAYSVQSDPKLWLTFKLFQCFRSSGLQHERDYPNWKCVQNKRKMKSRWGSDRARAAAFCKPLSDFLPPGSHLESDHHFCLVFIWTDEVIGI